MSARTDFPQLDASIREYGNHLIRVGGEINNDPGAFAFRNTGVVLPPEVILRGGAEHPDGTQWKSARQIMEMLGAWHHAKSHMEETWRAVPENQRGGLKPPIPNSRYR